ncbi:MAG: glycosyltransferase family 4 protein [Pirellulales bacterium]
MPSILYLCEYGTVNGGENSLLTLLPYVKAAGFDVTVASPGTGLLVERLSNIGVAHIPFSCWDDCGRRFSLAENRSRLATLLQAQAPDIHHSNSLSMSRLSGPVLREFNENATSKIIGIGHLRDILKLNRQVITDLNEQSQLIAVSQATLDFHVTQGLDVSRSIVLHNGVDRTKFFPNAQDASITKPSLHEELQLDSDKPLIGWVGQLGARKGLDVLVAAATTVVAEFPQAHFVVCGSRHSVKDEAIAYVKDAYEVIEQSGLSDSFSFLEHRPDIDQLMRHWCMLVHTAKQEPLGRVLLEAAASGLPVVATAVGGTAEIFPNDEAILVAPNQPAQTAESILGLLRSDELRRSYSEKVLARSKYFDIESIAESFISLYQTQ